MNALPMSIHRNTQLRWRSKMHHMSMNYCFPSCFSYNTKLVGGGILKNESWNWRHKVQLMRQYNVFPKIIGQTPPNGLAMFRKQIAPRTCAMHWWIYVHEWYVNKTRIVGKNHLQILLDENNHSNVQIPYHEDHQVKGWYVTKNQFEWVGRKFEVLVWFIIFHKKRKKPFDFRQTTLRVKIWKLTWFYDKGGWRNEGKGLCWVWIFVDMNQCKPLVEAFMGWRLKGAAWWHSLSTNKKFLL